jgi:GNAT superfamily N-acetyltransferase
MPTFRISRATGARCYPAAATFGVPAELREDGPVSIEVCVVSGYEDLARWVEVRNRALPDDPENPEMMALVRATELDHVDLFARVDGEICGTAMLAGDPHSVGSSHPYVEVHVLPEYRGRGARHALFEELSRVARALGKEGFVCEARSDDPAAVAFLEQRGFVEETRTDQYALDLARPPVPAPPSDVEVVWLANRPEFVAAMHAVAQAAYPGLSYRAARQAETLQDWQMYELGEPTLRLELTSVGLVDGEVVGYSPMIGLPALNAGRNRLIVRPGDRLREVALALVCAQAARARDLGLELIISWRRGEATAHVQEALGFTVRTRSIGFRGPLAGGSRP